MIRVMLPAHLRTLARVDGDVVFDLWGPVTQRAILDALETRFPVLRGTIRDHGSLSRRPFIRFYACGQDISHESPDDPVPNAIERGEDVFMIIGAMAGG